MNFYIVMQGRTYLEEKAKGVIWSSIKDKSGQTPHSWERLKEVKEGDAIFHYVKGAIVAISIAKQRCYEGINPYDENSSIVGFTVETDYEELERPLHIKENLEAIRSLFPLKYSAFQEDGDGNQGYLYPCNELLTLKLLELISDLNIYEKAQEQLEFAISTIASKERNTLIPVLTELESEAKAKLRKGQQIFTQGLLPLWDQQCALCGINLPALLKATHSKPWKDSTDEERLDIYNGLLLCHNHEALYAQGYIAFDGSGKIHISSEINSSEYGKYGIHSKMRVNRREGNKPYFKWHKRNIFRK